MATIPLGLGLATASHLYLCHRNLLQAERERQYHAELSERCELDLLFHSLSGKTLFSELIDLLDSTLHFHSDSNGNRSNGGDFRRKSCAGGKKKKMSSRPSPRHRRYQLQQEQEGREQQEQAASRPWPLLLSSSTVKITEVTGTTSGERDANAIDIDKQQQQPQLQPQPQQQQNTSPDPSSRDRTPRNAAVAVASSQHQSPPSPLPSLQNQALLHDHVELWIQACHQLRLAQERSVKETTDRIRARQPALWTLKVNIVVSLVLGTGMLAGLFKDRLPFTNIIPQLFTQLLTTTSAPSSYSNAAILRPSLFLCGVHFFTAFRTQWTLSELYPPPPPPSPPSPPSPCSSRSQLQGQRQRQSHLVFLNRTRAVTRCLEIREKRLFYLMQQIRAYERRIGPTTTATAEAASTTTITTAETAMMTGAMSCTALSFRSLVGPSRTTTTATSRMELTETVEERVEERVAVVGLDDDALGLEPSLVCMNTTRFLRDPIEQSRVLRMELQALRVDLESLHTMMML